ncbi:hypothetical protein [Streptomyces griseorubiginosus]|uniref:hypothetical protein n=1 Tax=Streptomyces griseorubiginosus TaxID=67304 RepID=UPI0036E634D9
MAWDHVRNEPVNVQNTQEEIGLLSAAAQRAEISGNTRLSELLHTAMNEEIDTLTDLKRNG